MICIIYSQPSSLPFMAPLLIIDITYVKRCCPSSNGPPAPPLTIQVTLYRPNIILDSSKLCHTLKILTSLACQSLSLPSILMALHIARLSCISRTMLKVMSLIASSTNQSLSLGILTTPSLGCTSLQSCNVHLACIGVIMSPYATQYIHSVLSVRVLIRPTPMMPSLPKVLSIVLSSCHVV